MTFIASWEFPKLHASRRWRVRRSTVGFPCCGPSGGSGHRLPTQQSSFLAQAATLRRRVIGSVNNSRIAMNNVPEATYGAARRPKLGVATSNVSVFRGVVNSRTFDLFAGEKVLDLIPWRWQVLLLFLCLLLLLILLLLVFAQLVFRLWLLGQESEESH